MDEDSLISALKKFSIASAMLILSCAGAHASVQTDDASRITALEKRFFFQSYGSESRANRLARIEKRVFGQALDGSESERLARLVEAAGQSLADGADSKPGEAEVTRAQAAMPHEPPAATAAAAPAPARSPLADAETERYAIERARVNVMAAKEEEIRTLMGEAVVLWRSKRTTEAMEKFEQVVRLDRTNAEAHFSLGIIAEAQGNFVEALASYKQASRYRPASKEYRDAIAVVEKKFAAKQQQDGARAELRMLAEDATAAYQRGEYLSALDLFKTLDEKAPNQHLVKYNIATIYLVLKQPEKACEFYRQALRLNPGEPRYQKAVEQLEGVMERMKDQQKVAQAQYRSAKAPATQPPAGRLSLLSSYGLLAKSGSGGVVVTTVGLASKASKTGIQRGDIIRAVNGIVVKSENDINEAIARAGGGSAPLSVMIERGNQIAQITL